MTDPDGGQTPPSIRIGTAERNDALKALDAHLEAGRLDAMEYGDRSAHVAEARTADEIRPLFVDLPAPHPRLPGDASAPAPVDTDVPATTSPDRPAQGGLARWGPRVAALMPLVAIALFLLVPGHFWWFFLLIPAAGVMMGKSHDGHRDHDELHGHGHEDRHRRRPEEQDGRRPGREDQERD